MEADIKPFDNPVKVELGPIGSHRMVKSTKEAAECLLTDWPLNRGPRHGEALDACLKVLDGHRSTSDARDAFIEAAKESEILAPDQDLH
ncbi:DUF982 domain-containing protein [Mesorhizobium sp. SB112]|jgi:hypothetical protein|uniref:DUF982 domain-containing protein n=1 Tax=Mesorhizobium sp. SB112 TaxID=3151853 RepID=UPI003264C4A4